MTEKELQEWESKSIPPMNREDLMRWHETIRLIVIDSYLKKIGASGNYSGQNNGNGKEKSHG